MKRSLLVLFLGILLCPVTVLGAEQSQKDTQVGVTITEPPLWLESISSLRFGTHQLPDKETLAIHPENDLVVKIKDTRTARNPWNLSLTTGTFKAGTQQLSDATLEFADGKLANPQQKIIGQTTQIMKLGQKKQLLTGITDEQGEFYYQVPRNEITLNIPAGSQAGNYAATMNWLLSDAP